MRSYIFRLFLFFSLLFAFVFSVPAFAQYNTIPQDDINIAMSPENPGPNQNVSVSLTSYSTSIDAATITWRVNGKTIQSGLGLKDFSFTTGGVNTTTTLSVVVNASDGQRIVKTISIKPASVDLLWQTDSYTPPFYKGKPLFSYQNFITFIAVPHMVGSNGVEIGPKSLIYKWTLNGTVDAANSGAGKNTYSLQGSIIARPLNMQVEVTSPNNDGVGIANTNVTPINPSIVFYAKSPIYGIAFQNAFQNTESLSGSQEVTVVAEPFFFGNLLSNSSDLSYAWTVNGVNINDDGHQPEQVFRQPAGTSGTSNISVTVTSADKILQTADNNFYLNFGKNTAQTSASFF